MPDTEEALGRQVAVLEDELAAEEAETTHLAAERASAASPKRTAQHHETRGEPSPCPRKQVQ